MRIRRSKPVDNFTIIPNGTLRDDRLSYCARGILGELLSRPSGWETNADALSERARRHRGDTVGEGRRALRAAFKELESAGYMLRRKEKGEKGRIVTVLEVFDVPQAGAPEEAGRGTGDRGTAGGTSADGMSVRGTSASGTSIRSNDVRRTEKEDPFEQDSTPSSSAAAPPAESMAVVPDGGGGGVSPSRDLAIEIAAALTAGQPVHKQLQETLTARLAAALDAGWTVDGLAVYLHMGEGFTGSVAAVASWRLDPQRLPAAEPLPAPVRAAGGIRGPLPSADDYAAMTVDSVPGTGRDTADGGLWERAMARANQRMCGPRPGTDTTVAGWGDVARQLRTEHKPYSNDTWSQPADPAEAAKIPHCGHWECDPDTRLRPGPTPQDKPDPCSVCHPAFRF